jgi:hypothetical protein
MKNPEYFYKSNFKNHPKNPLFLGKAETLFIGAFDSMFDLNYSGKK